MPTLSAILVTSRYINVFMLITDLAVTWVINYAARLLRLFMHTQYTTQ